MLNLQKIRESGFTFKIVWDLFMVLVLFLNFFLIICDMSYLFLRPVLFRFVPLATTLYDQVKGIEPHPMTNKIVIEADELIAALDANKPKNSQEVQKLITSLATLSMAMIQNSPFIDSGQSKNLQKIVDIAEERLINEKRISSDHTLEPEQILALFWDINARTLEIRTKIYQDDLRPLLRVNYERRKSLDGEYVDYFILFDLPFLIFFFWEFAIRWFFAVIRKDYVRWFLYPLYHWYDIVGLFPYGYLRAFRLFRIVSIYVRLKGSDVTTIGDDFLSTAFKRYSDIVTEEVSDMVAIRILTEVQEEIESGQSIDIVVNALEPKRDEIKRLVVDITRDFIRKTEPSAEFRLILKETLARTAERIPYLKMLPGPVKDKLVVEIGLTIFDAIMESLIISMTDSEKRAPIENLVDYVIDDIIRVTENSTARNLTTEISLEIIENVKKAVAVKKWAEEAPATPEPEPVEPNNKLATPEPTQPETTNPETLQEA